MVVGGGRGYERLNGRAIGLRPEEMAPPVVSAFTGIEFNVDLVDETWTNFEM